LLRANFDPKRKTVPSNLGAMPFPEGPM